jgi:hypothetical protein
LKLYYLAGVKEGVFETKNLNKLVKYIQEDWYIINWLQNFIKTDYRISKKNNEFINIVSINKSWQVKILKLIV